MDKRTIVFKQGEENGIVIEREQLEYSIFLNQYQQAIDAFQRLWKSQQALKDSNQFSSHSFSLDNQISNIIAFCGDRGEGKSSCMSTFANILTDSYVRNNARSVIQEPEDMLGCQDIEWLDMIDPSFFDTKHNLLELLLGRMYAKIASVMSDNTTRYNDCESVSNHRKLMEQFQKVKKDVTMIERATTAYDSLEEISDLAAGVNLKSDIQKLFEYYLKFLHKNCLLLCIDDIDLNISEGYKMAEILRKYLICPQCIILVAVKVEQLVEVVATAHMNEVKNTKITWDDCQIMAQKYVTKLLPLGNRIMMPVPADYCEYSLNIVDENNVLIKNESKLTVKEKIVQLIFQKTGYVFYNTQRLSPIIPKNLRSIRHLLGLLYALPDAKDINGIDVEIGRDAFKEYFFGTWATQLTDRDYMFAQRLYQYDDLTTLNAFVVEYFAKRIKEDTKIEISETDLDEEYAKLYLSITSNKNTASNISFGDVMYMLWFISGITLDVDIQNLIFLIKTLYSIRLYACYNVISQGDDALYPPTPDVKKVVHIHKAETLYEHVNQLQKLINGSYFTYPQGVLLPVKDNKTFRDRLIIPMNKIVTLIKGIRKSENIDVNKLRLCEYLALCITRTTTYKEKEYDLGYNRLEKTPTYLGSLSSTANYLQFDFLQPFTSLCNIKYAYKRFDDIFEVGQESEQYTLFDLAKQIPDSLLNTLLSNLSWKSAHALISDVVIRVADVQWAIFEELLRKRDLHKNGDESLFSAYADIQKLQIKLYPIIKKDDSETAAGILNFKFLSQFSCVNTNELQNIIFISKEERLRQEMKTQLNAIRTIFETFYLWPMSGKEIKEQLCNSMQLDKEQSANFKRALSKTFKNKEEYTQNSVLDAGVLKTILKDYLKVKNNGH